MKGILTALAVTTIVTIAAPARAASFDCAKAATPDEKAVCTDPQISELDDLLGTAFAQARAKTSDATDRAQLLAMGRRFLAARRACGTAKPCILTDYVGALTEYQFRGAQTGVPPWVNALVLAGGQGPAAAALPTRIGQCSTTEVKEVTSRLETDTPRTDPNYFDGGTAILFSNKGYQVSYEREPGAHRLKTGRQSGDVPDRPPA